MQNKIYVGNLSYSLKENDLREAFSSKGEITDIAFPLDRQNNDRPRGFAFITFKKESDAEAALALHETELKGRKIVVKYALERKDEGGGGRRRGGGGSNW